MMAGFGAGPMPQQPFAGPTPTGATGPDMKPVIDQMKVLLEQLKEINRRLDQLEKKSQ